MADTRTDERLAREQAWLRAEVRAAADLTDADRVRILLDLLRTAEAIQAAKSDEERARDDDVRRQMDEGGKARYRALVERLA